VVRIDIRGRPIPLGRCAQRLIRIGLGALEATPDVSVASFYMVISSMRNFVVSDLEWTEFSSVGYHHSDFRL